jgi:AcrR family transcriptional regulator
MPRRRQQPDASKDMIVAAAIAILRERGASGFTVEAVASKAGCAKGLVHYHFKTKRGLSSALADEILRSRMREWQSVLGSSRPEEAIHATWRLLVDESSDGTLRSWDAAFGEASPVTDREVRDALASYAASLGQTVSGLLARLGLHARIPPSEIGWLASAVVLGMGSLLERGVPPADLEGAYSAAWLGILSLASPSTTS